MAKSYRSKPRRYNDHSRKWGKVPPPRSPRADPLPGQQAELARQRIEGQLKTGTIVYKVACHLISMFAAHPARSGLTRLQSAEQLTYERIRGVLTRSESHDHSAVRKGVSLAKQALWGAGNELRERRSG